MSAIVLALKLKWLVIKEVVLTRFGVAITNSTKDFAVVFVRIVTGKLNPLIRGDTLCFIHLVSFCHPIGRIRFLTSDEINFITAVPLTFNERDLSMVNVRLIYRFSTQ